MSEILTGTPAHGFAPLAFSESSLYPAVKEFLEGQGYVVKGEIGGCDVVGVRDDGRVLVIAELKRRFNLELVLQGIDRMPAADEVWLAVEMTSRSGREGDRRVRKLCRLLGVSCESAGKAPD